MNELERQSWMDCKMEFLPMHVERLHASMCSLHRMTQRGESPRVLFTSGRDVNSVEVAAAELAAAEPAVASVV